MLVGNVDEHDEPVVEITLNLKGEKIHPSAIVDTGFNGYLSVPREMVERSNWEFLGFEDYELANGELALEEVFWGKIVFGGEPKEVYTLATDSSDILIGTKLLKDKVLWIDFPKGVLRIESGNEKLQDGK